MMLQIQFEQIKHDKVKGTELRLALNEGLSSEISKLSLKKGHKMKSKEIE